MPHAFSQCKHPFGQCKHFSQIESFEKLWIFVVQLYKKYLVGTKIYPLYFLIKHLKACSLREIIPWGNLVIFLLKKLFPIAT